MPSRRPGVAVAAVPFLSGSGSSPTGRGRLAAAQPGLSRGQRAREKPRCSSGSQ